MEKKHKYYFKVLNDELFGGEGSEGYMSLAFTDKEDNATFLYLLGGA